MYPPSNSCSYSPIFNITSPCLQYGDELFFQYYHDHFLQEQQLPLIEDQSLDILADSTEIVTNPLNCTGSVKILYNIETVSNCQGPKGNEEERVKGRENKRDDMSSTISIIHGRKNKKCSNKDRHSKINTARGPRDRRMRLSLDAARKFFSLQDMLGFDKASKTVEWLLNKSESEIEELAKGSKGRGTLSKQSCSTTSGIISSISECEVMSGTDEFSSVNDKRKLETAKGPTIKKAKTARRVAFDPLITKETRNQARARARERTKLKKSLGKCKENSADDCILVVNDGNGSSFSIFNYQQNAGISHEQQFTDFQFCGNKLWEV